MFDEVRSGTAIQYLPCRAHPGTEHRAVRGFLMVRMLGLVVERLCGGHTANHNETDDQEAGEGTLKEPMRHSLHSSRNGEEIVLERVRLSQSVPVCVFTIGFRKCFRYTEQIRSKHRPEIPLKSH